MSSVHALTGVHAIASNNYHDLDTGAFMLLMMEIERTELKGVEMLGSNTYEMQLFTRREQIRTSSQAEPKFARQSGLLPCLLLFI